MLAVSPAGSGFRRLFIGRDPARHNEFPGASFQPPLAQEMSKCFWPGNARQGLNLRTEAAGGFNQPGGRTDGGNEPPPERLGKPERLRALVADERPGNAVTEVHAARAGGLETPHILERRL